jgi:hypothetical protein
VNLYAPLADIVVPLLPRINRNLDQKAPRPSRLQDAAYGLRRRPQRVEKLPWCSLSPQIGYENTSFATSKRRRLTVAVL